MPQRTIFISYTHTDEEWAKMIGSVLEEMGHKVISMYKGFPGNFLARIKEAYDECDDIILVFSPVYETSGYCEHERTVALKREIDEKRGSVHLVKVDPYLMNSFYSVLTFIDLSLFTPGSPEVKPHFMTEMGKRLGTPDQKPNAYTIHNLPFRIPNFAGRNLTIENLHNDFFSATPEMNVQVLCGLAGVGKTKVALEYAYRYIDQYTIIWFFHAEDSSQLRQEISNLAKTLKLPEAQSENIEHHSNALKRYLENKDRWLLIFDNAAVPRDISGVFPSVPRGHILVTSRNPGWGSIACVHTIENFSKEESVAFLKKRLNRTNEIPCLGTVAEKLAYLPLALNSAAAYIDTNQMNCDEYKSILEETPDIIKKIKTDENVPLLNVWGHSLEKIQQKSQQSIVLLEYLSNFSPDEIPEEVLYPVLQNIPDISDKVKHKAAYYQILSLLLQYSFVTKNMENKTLSMHRLVQDGVMYMMDQERKKQQVADLVNVLSQQFPIKSTDPETIDFEMWQKCRQMLPHATKVAELAEKFRVSPEHTIHLYAQIASFLRELNNLTEAEIYANRALAIVNRIGIIDSLHHVVCLETRARILRDLGRNIEAEDLMLRAIAIEEKQRGEVTGVHNQKNSLIDRSHLAVCYDGYGRILSNLNQSQKSLEYYSKALALDLKTYGDNHPKIAIRKNNIGCAYGQLGNDDLNIKNLKEALAIEETYYANKHQEKHPHIAIRLSNLALAYEKNRDRDLSGTNLDLAHQYWNQSIDINHGFYGLSSNHTLSSIYGLAGHFRIRKEYEKALEQNNKAINITKGSDPDGYYHALSFLHRGNTYTEKEENVNALADYQQAAHLISCSRGTENSDYSVILQNIAYIKFKQGDIPAAVENQEKSLEIDMRNKRTSGQGYGIALLNLGMYCLQAHEHVKAKNAFSLALPLLEKECGTYSQNYFYALCAFIDTKINTKDTADISELIQKGRKIKDFLNKNA